MNHPLVIAPLLLPLLAGIVSLLTRGAAPGIRHRLAIGVALAQIALALALIQAVAGGDILVYRLGDWPAPFGIVLVADRLAAWMLLTVALLALPALLYAIGGAADGRHFHTLFQLELFGLNGAFLTGDLFNLFVFFEVLLIASYALALQGGGAARTRAGLHYAIANLAGSALFLFAVGTLFGVLGTLNLADLAVQVAAAPPRDLPLIRAAALLLFGVFALKAALVPLHLWLPATYAETGAAVAALFAIMTKVGAYAILRVYPLVFGPQAGAAADPLGPWLLPLALVTLAAGTLGVMGSDRLRRQVAYLVVVSIGTLLAAFALGSAGSIGGGLYYLPHSTFAAAALFLLADRIAERRGATGDRLEPGPVMARHALLGGLFFVLAVSVAGLPPLSGFVGKLLILQAALERPEMPWVLATLLVCALLGVMALARTGSLLFFRATAIESPPDGPFVAALAPIALLLGLGVAMTLWAGPLSDYTRSAAGQVLEPSGYIRAVLYRDAEPRP